MKGFKFEQVRTARLQIHAFFFSSIVALSFRAKSPPKEQIGELYDLVQAVCSSCIKSCVNVNQTKMHHFSMPHPIESSPPDYHSVNLPLILYFQDVAFTTEEIQILLRVPLFSGLQLQLCHCPNNYRPECLFDNYGFAHSWKDEWYIIT